MRFTIKKKLPRAEEIIQNYPISEQAFQKIDKDKQELQNILAGRDSRKILIVGPCSAWPFDGVIEYAKKLKKLSDKVEDKLKIVMRCYIQKPRTTKGWLGPVNQPDPYEEPDIAKGAFYARNLMVQIIEMGLPIADEAVFTHNAKGFVELLAWMAIGARSTEDQEHRIFASAVDCPVGMKNPTSGLISTGVNSVLVAQHPHTAVFDGLQVETLGNPYAHLVLRGGAQRSNYHAQDLYEAKKFLEEAEVLNPAVIVDASHDNCKINGSKNAIQQIQVVKEIMSTLKLYPELNKLVKGFMIESFLKRGSQKIESLLPDEVDMQGLSITDPCLSWEDTEELIHEIVNTIN